MCDIHFSIAIKFYLEVRTLLEQFLQDDQQEISVDVTLMHLVDEYVRHPLQVAFHLQHAQQHSGGHEQQARRRTFLHLQSSSRKSE